jgi:hypothetical protein
MTGISVETEVGFSDGEVVGYERTDNRLQVRVRAWNDKNLLLVFTGVIGVADRNIGALSDVTVSGEKTEFVAECLRLYYEEVPSDHKFKLFAFIDQDEDPTLEVVAEALEIRTV